MNPLADYLSLHFNPVNSGQLDATVGFHAGPHAAVARIEAQTLSVTDATDHPAATDFVLYFASLDEAIGIFSGHINPVESFMQARLRSSGYILWSFQVLRSFQKA